MQEEETKRPVGFIVGLAVCALLAAMHWKACDVFASTFNPDPPASPVKLIFVHHSTGQNWLADEDGGLGIALRDSNYFVSDTNYGWGPYSAGVGGPAGDGTDIGHWWNWFNGPDSGAITAALYGEYGQHSGYGRMAADPGGENEVIMFKSCFPNSALKGGPDEEPPEGDNPLRGQSSGSDAHTVGNARGIYKDLLDYFATRQDKLFVVIAAPPLRSPTYAANARAFNNWLVDEWLKGYPYRNVAVFDFYNVLTSNGGNSSVNDLGEETGNHHRWWKGLVQHKTDDGADVLRYPSGDDHPNRAGNLKATGEYVDFLNVFYHCWKGTGGCPGGATHSISLVKEGSGEGSVASSPPGISCGEQCSAAFPEGTVVTLTASAAAGSVFSGWSDACTGEGACTVTLDGDIIVGATFLPAPCAYSLSAAGRTFPGAGGSVSVTVRAKGSSCSQPAIGVSHPSWISASLQASAKNRWTVKVTANRNESSLKRTGEVLLADRVFAVGQSGAGCKFAALEPASQNVPGTGGSYSFAVSAVPGDCAWQVASTVSWIDVATGDGSGDGTVWYAVDPNDRPRTRSGAINILSLQTGTRKNALAVRQGR